MDPENAQRVKIYFPKNTRATRSYKTGKFSNFIRLKLLPLSLTILQIIDQHLHKFTFSIIYCWKTKQKEHFIFLLVVWFPLKHVIKLNGIQGRKKTIFSLKIIATLMMLASMITQGLNVKFLCDYKIKTLKWTIPHHSKVGSFLNLEPFLPSQVLCHDLLYMNLLNLMK